LVDLSYRVGSVKVRYSHGNMPHPDLVEQPRSDRARQFSLVRCTLRVSHPLHIPLLARSKMRQDDHFGQRLTIVDDETSEVVEELWLPYEKTVDRDLSSNDHQAVPSPIDTVSPIGYAALCSACQESMCFYEPGSIFTTCRSCRLLNGAAACGPDQIVMPDTSAYSERAKYQCPCGSTVLDRKRHEASKKHRLWRRGNARAPVQ
jgi:hypothetical protein